MQSLRGLTHTANSVTSQAMAPAAAGAPLFVAATTHRISFKRINHTLPSRKIDTSLERTQPRGTHSFAIAIATAGLSGLLPRAPSRKKAQIQMEIGVG